MSEYLWVVAVVGFIISPLLLVFVFFGYLRAKRPHSKKKADEQEKLDKKQGASSGTAPAPLTSKKVGGEKSIKWLFILVGVIVALLLGYMMLPTSPSLPGAPSSPVWSMQSWSPTPEGVWKSFKDHWFWMALILGLPFAVLFAFKETWAKAVQGGIATVVIILVGAMIVHGIWGDKPSVLSASSRVEIPLASRPPSEWGKWIIPPEGKSEVNISPPGMHLVAVGDNFRLHAVYPDGRECSFGEVCPNASEIRNYARNLSKAVNTVRFAFAPN